MKKKSSIIAFLVITTILLAGCSKYEEDKSYDTDLYGTYSYNIEASNVSYSLSCKYYFNKDDTYNYTYKEISNDTVTNDVNENGKILSIEEISNGITKITLEDDTIIYKYKNMIGKLYITEIPKGKNFDLIIPAPRENWTGSYPNAANVFDKNGFYHSCLDITKCEDTEENYTGIYYKYVRKNNLIYFVDSNVEDTDYQILFYIVDGYLFSSELYKAEE